MRVKNVTYHPIRESNCTALKRGIGLGDIVASVAEPIRKAIGMKPCASCAKRKAALNKISL